MSTHGSYWHEYHDCHLQRCVPDGNGIYSCGWSFEKQNTEDDARQREHEARTEAQS